MNYKEFKASLDAKRAAKVAPVAAENVVEAAPAKETEARMRINKKLENLRKRLLGGKAGPKPKA